MAFTSACRLRGILEALLRRPQAEIPR